MTTRVKACLLLVAALLMFLEPARGSQQDKRRLAITDASQADADFKFQGEYAGTILHWDACGRARPAAVGLQVVALGDGKFSAKQHGGGLPGNGCFSAAAMHLQGERHGDVVRLRSSTHAVTIQHRHALMASASGQTLGRIPKVRRTSLTLGALPPHGAIVLFDGTNAEHFKNGKLTSTGLLNVGTEFKYPFRDYTLHIEFRLPYMPFARGQGRGNSGVYLQSRYELQILDSFGLEGEFNECGAMYRYRKPDLNMCFPPLTWQTYDVHFLSPRFDIHGRKCSPARITVWHNGVVVHNNVVVSRKTGSGKPEGPRLLPTRLQDHRSPVHLRNIWLIDHSLPSPRIFATRPAAPSPLRFGWRVRRHMFDMR